MSRLLVILGLVALIVAVPATHDVVAKKADKVKICHVNGSNSPGSTIYRNVTSYDYTAIPPLPADKYDFMDTIYGYTSSTTYHVGRVIEVSENALKAHLAHGDSEIYYALTDDMADKITSLEDTDFDLSSSSTTVFPPYYTRQYRRDYWKTSTNGVIKNADCWWTTNKTRYE